MVHYYTLKIIGVEIICQYSGDLSHIFNFANEPDYLKDKPQYKTNIIPVLKAMSRDRKSVV